MLLNIDAQEAEALTRWGGSRATRGRLQLAGAAAGRIQERCLGENSVRVSVCVCVKAISLILFDLASVFLSFYYIMNTVTDQR